MVVPVLVFSGNPRYHTSINCPQIFYTPSKINKRDQLTVQTAEMARENSKSRCRTNACNGQPYYWFGEDQKK